jgi:ubiquinone/menaquinone biosynthesis C-methylase UbiE
MMAFGMADGPLKRVLGSVVSNGFVYDTLQRAVGSNRFDTIIRNALEPIAPDCTVIDAGGGTGLSRNIWPLHCDYVIIDNDPVKLEAYARKNLPGKAIIGDITAFDFESGSVDFVFSKWVSHHLDDQSLEGFLVDSSRILNVGGKLVFFEALYSTDKALSKVMWRYDRGSCPRNEETLLGVLNRHFTASRTDFIDTPFHRHVLYIGSPNTGASRAAAN